MFGLPNPYLIGGGALLIASLTGWALWERHDAIAAAKGEKAALERMELAQADATRWHKASDDRDQAMAQVVEAYKRQTDKVNEGRARESEMQAAISAVGRKNRDLADKADALARELDDEAARVPGDVRELGPIVAKRVDQLFN